MVALVVVAVVEMLLAHVSFIPIYSTENGVVLTVCGLVTEDTTFRSRKLQSSADAKTLTIGPLTRQERIILLQHILDEPTILNRIFSNRSQLPEMLTIFLRPLISKSISRIFQGDRRTTISANIALVAP